MFWFSFIFIWLYQKNIRAINVDCEVNLNSLMENFDFVYEVQCNLTQINGEFISKHAVAWNYSRKSNCVLSSFVYHAHLSIFWM